ncbi:hypothetical protein BC628DRAFT_1123408 [Trametes gibbosa]|nr:hypothetical protein BC628DRAFT_1123408 [Trametes gibbosa]
MTKSAERAPRTSYGAIAGDVWRNEWRSPGYRRWHTHPARNVAETPKWPTQLIVSLEAGRRGYTPPADPGATASVERRSGVAAAVCFVESSRTRVDLRPFRMLPTARIFPSRPRTAHGHVLYPSASSSAPPLYLELCSSLTVHVQNVSGGPTSVHAVFESCRYYTCLDLRTRRIQSRTRICPRRP